jgi:predicted amidohydrolase YtcJ
VHVITLIRDSNDVCGWGQIEHAQHLSAGAPERFQANGVVASVQVWLIFFSAFFLGRVLDRAIS